MSHIITSLLGTSGNVTVSAATGRIILSLPTGLTSINSVTAESGQNLTLTGGSSGASLTLGQGTNGAVTITPSGTGAARIVASGAVGSTYGVNGVSYAFAKTDTTERNVAGWTSNEAAGSTWKLLLTATGNATASSRVWGFQTSNEGVANNGVLALQALGGNVGIGTTNPLALLQVSDSSAGIVAVGKKANTGSGDLIGTIRFAGQVGQAPEASYTNLAGIRAYQRTNGANQNSGDLALFTSNANIATDRLYITTTGNTLIGGTTDISGSGGLKVFGTTASTSTTSGSLINAGGFGNAGAFYNGGSAFITGDLTVSGGNVGIGVANSTNMGLRIETTDLAGTTQYGGSVIPTFTSAATAAGYGLRLKTQTAAAAFTQVTASPLYIAAPGIGAASAVTTNTGITIENQGATGITNAYGIDIAAQSGAATTNVGLRNAGTTLLTNATEASALGTASVVLSGGLSVAKSAIIQGGTGFGVTSTATAAGTTTLTAASRTVQIFTGSAPQTVQLPSAAALGAGISIVYVIVNKSSETITIAATAGQNIEGAATYFMSSGLRLILTSDGVDSWTIV